MTSEQQTMIVLETCSTPPVSRERQEQTDQGWIAQSYINKIAVLYNLKSNMKLWQGFHYHN